MTENTYDDGNVSGETDSNVIGALRKQNRDLSKRVQEYEQARTDAAASILTASGYGKLADVYLSKVEGFPTQETVQEFLADLGLEAKKSEVSDVKSETAKADAVVEPERVSASELGQRVATAAVSGSETDLMSKIANAKNAADVDRIMEEAGLVA